MNRTIVGRITTLRGARHQIETFLRQATDLGDWAPIAVTVLIFVFVRSYQDEQKKMLAERTHLLKQEKAQFERVERQLVREMSSKTATPGFVRRALPKRVQRST